MSANGSRSAPDWDFYFSTLNISILKPGDYPAFSQPYITVLGDVELMETMGRQLNNFPEFLESIPEGKWHFAYAKGNWTIAEVILHIIDAERIFQYRALRIARKDQTPLAGFDQDTYVPNSGAGHRSRKSLIEEYKAVRQASLSLFKTFDDEVLCRRGTASNSPVTVLALGFMICGHQKHHRNIIRERYLKT
jgi:uncharacterized damage-inducible protein DinB